MSDQETHDVLNFYETVVSYLCITTWLLLLIYSVLFGFPEVAIQQLLVCFISMGKIQTMSQFPVIRVIREDVEQLRNYYQQRKREGTLIWINPLLPIKLVSKVIQELLLYSKLLLIGVFVELVIELISSLFLPSLDYGNAATMPFAIKVVVDVFLTLTCTVCLVRFVVWKLPVPDLYRNY